MHHTNPKFWRHYNDLPESVQKSADRCYDLLRENPNHPSLHFKKVGKYWSVRAGLDHRALGIEFGGGIIWFWIGTHGEYERIIAHA